MRLFFNLAEQFAIFKRVILEYIVKLTLPTAKAGGFLLQPLLHWLIPYGIAMAYTVSTS